MNIVLYFLDKIVHSIHIFLDALVYYSLKKPHQHLLCLFLHLQSKDGKTPLHMAATHGRFSCSQALIQNGASSNSSLHASCLNYVCRRGVMCNGCLCVCL